MSIKRREYVSGSKYDRRSSDFWGLINQDSSFRVEALKSPFLKGDLGGFSTASEIPPDPPFVKGGHRERCVMIFPFNPLSFAACVQKLT